MWVLFCVAAHLSGVHGLQALAHTRTRPLVPGYASARAAVVGMSEHDALLNLRGGATEGALGRLWSRYTTASDEHPMTTKMVTAFVLAIIGDIIAQVVEGAKVIVAGRCFSLGVINVVYLVPVLSFFYAMNERLINALGMERGTWQTTGVQLAFDQLVNAPIVILGFYTVFSITNALRSGSLAALLTVAASVQAKVQAEYVNTLISNWKVWVLPQLFNFAVVPPPLRVGFANCVGLVWTVILSILANR